MQFAKGDISWGVLTIEVVAIVFGVLLGLAGNEYRQSLNEQRSVNDALTNIQNELKTNAADLERVVPYYRQVRDSLEAQALSVGADARFVEFDVGWSGFRILALRSSSYDAALYTGALSSMDFELVDKLSGVYTFQDGFYDVFRLSMQSGSVHEKTAEDMYIVLADLIALGEQILQEHKETTPLIVAARGGDTRASGTSGDSAYP